MDILAQAEIFVSGGHSLYYGQVDQWFNWDWPACRLQVQVGKISESCSC